MKLYCRAPIVDDPGDRNGSPVCNAYLGQAPLKLVLYAVVRYRTPRKPALEPYKDVRRCPKCGWWNVFIPEDMTLRVKAKAVI